LEIVPHRDVVEQEIHQHFSLGLFKSNDLDDELAVQKETPLASDRVHAHQRVDGFYGVLAIMAAYALDVCDHLGGRMNGQQIVKKCAHGRRETAEGGQYAFGL
jgi:hypothetical protein